MAKDYKKFRKEIWRYYRHHKRVLPWRKTQNPYHILISEIMLQQTQVGRVIPYYQAFIKAFPNFETLSRASTAQVLKLWQGLGYNRRALNLKKLVKIVLEKYGGELPHDPEILKNLPGIGKGTAGAIAAFAFGKPVPFLETNIRRVFIHFFFRKKKNVNDREILKYVEATLDRKNPREWYYALMDYGAMLAKTTENPNRRSRSYHRQSRFRGSNRELRGKILKLFLQKQTLTESAISFSLAEPKSRLKSVLAELKKEGFLKKKNRRFALAS